MLKMMLVFSCFFPVFSWAKTTVEFCSTRTFIGLQIRNNSDFPTVNCADIQVQLENALDTVQSITSVDLSSTYLIVYNQALAKGSSYSWVTSTMSVDITDIRDTKTMAVFYHELGHKIFFDTMAKVVGEISDRLPALVEYQDYLKKCQTSSTPAPGCNPELASQKIKTLNASFSQDFNRFIYIVTPYNELFADVVASIAANDADAVAQLMAECTSSDYACEYRRFSKNTIDKYAGENPYARFSSIRRDLWEGYVVPRLSDSQSLLLELAQIFVDESYSNYVEDYKLIEGMSELKQIKRLNERLKLKSLESPTIQYGL